MEYFKFNKGFAFFMAISSLTLSACNAGNGGGDANSTVGSNARVANIANTSYESTQIATILIPSGLLPVFLEIYKGHSLLAFSSPEKLTAFADDIVTKNIIAM